MQRLHLRLGAMLLAVLLFMTCAPAAAFAQGAKAAPSAPSAPAAPSAPSAPQDDAKRQGDEAMISLRYEDALANYRRAYEVTRSTALLYNMGRAYEGLGDFPKALDALEEFAEKASPELKARVPKLDALLADVRKRVATMIVSTQVSGADIRLGGKSIGTTRPGQTIFRVNAGAQSLTVTHQEYFPFERPVTLAAGKIETVDVNLASRAQEALLRVTSPVSGASVSVDGTAIGNVPAEAPMKPGQHLITLRRSGYDTAETSVVLAAGEKKDVNVPMAVHETITGKWWFWTGIGAAVVLGSIATYVVLTTEKDPDAGTIAPGTVKTESFGFRF